jgi:hypothetical protein
MTKKCLIIALVIAIIGSFAYIVVQYHASIQTKRDECTESISAVVQDIEFSYNSARTDLQKNYNYVFKYEIDGVEYENTEILARTVPVEDRDMIGTSVEILYNPSNHQKFIVSDESADLIYDQVSNEYYKPNVIEVLMLVALIVAAIYTSKGKYNESK